MLLIVFVSCLGLAVQEQEEPTPVGHSGFIELSNSKLVALVKEENLRLVSIDDSKTRCEQNFDSEIEHLMFDTKGSSCFVSTADGLFWATLKEENSNTILAVEKLDIEKENEPSPVALMVIENERVLVATTLWRVVFFDLETQKTVFEWENTSAICGAARLDSETNEVLLATEYQLFKCNWKEGMVIPAEKITGVTKLIDCGVSPTNTVCIKKRFHPPTSFKTLFALRSSADGLMEGEFVDTGMSRKSNIAINWERNELAFVNSKSQLCVFSLDAASEPSQFLIDNIDLTTICSIRYLLNSIEIAFLADDGELNISTIRIRGGKDNDGLEMKKGKLKTNGDRFE